MSVRFVVFSGARSGTSLLTGSLNKHPNIYCHGEIFHPNIKWHIRQEYQAAFDIAQRETDPVGFCYSVLGFSNNRAAVGFKMWLNQSLDASMALLRDSAVKKIILERENRLAQFSSALLAKQTGVWNIVGNRNSRSDAPQLPKFSPQAFAKFIKHQDNAFQTYATAARGNILRLSYVDVARMDFGPIYRFLEVEPIPTPPATRKLYSDNILKRFDPSCREVISGVLAELDRREWATERLE